MLDKNITSNDVSIDYIPTNIAIYRYSDGDFIFIDFNKMAEKTENIRKEDLLGKRLTKIFSGVKEFGLFDILLDVHKNGGYKEMDICFYSDKRISGWRHNSVNRLPNGDLLVSYTDMTKQKTLEEENFKKKNQLEDAEKIAHLGSWKWNIKSNEIRWSDEVFRIFGEEPQSFSPTYDLFLSYLSEEGQNSLQEAVTDSLKYKSHYLFSHKIHRKDGTERYVQESGNAQFDDQGEAIFMIGTVQDITEHFHLEEKLKLSASVFTYAREGIIITDIDKNMIDVNQAFVDITGFSHSEVLGKNPNILQSGRQDANFYKQLWNTLEQDGVWEGDVWNRKKSGEEYLQHLTITAVYDDNKLVQNYVALFTDITLQKQQQEELEHIAHYDMLTNLPNRVLFYDRMQQAISQATRRGQLISVVYVDLDGFKEVNDRYGHDVGDKLLISLAQRMNEEVRVGDSISRVGGDEFIALLIDVSDKTSVISFITRLIEIIAEPVLIDDLLINVSASIGVTFYPQMEELDVDQIIKQADQAMYQAKLYGKNRYFIFNTEDNFQYTI